MGRMLKDIFSFGDCPFSERIVLLVFIVVGLIFPWFIESAYARAVMIKFLLIALFGAVPVLGEPPAERVKETVTGTVEIRQETQKKED